MQSLHTNSVKPCKSTTTNPPSPRQTIPCSSCTPQQLSLSIYSTSYTSFPVYYSSNSIFAFNTAWKFACKVCTPTVWSHANLHLLTLKAPPNHPMLLYLPSKPRQTIPCSSCTLSLLSLSIYSTSYTSFPVYYSSNPFFACKICMQPPLLCLKTIISMNLLYILHLLPRLLFL